MKPAAILSVAAILAGLYGVDRFLAALERSELSREARTHYLRGSSLVQAGNARTAVDELRRAHVLARRDRTYQLALAQALLSTGRLEEATSNLRALLDTDSNDGATNLTMARLQAHAGNAVDADAYYHRALYGTWPQGSETQPVRMELAEFLAAKGLQRELLSELLLLRDEAGPDAAVSRRLRVARLFLAAESPASAAAVYRSVIRQDQANVEAHFGLGEANLAEGRFVSAQASFLEALQRKPGDPATISRLRLTTALSALDPTPRRLPSREKFNRSTTILGLTADDLVRCSHARVLPPGVPALLNSADRLRNQPGRGPITNEIAEVRLSLAERLWEVRVETCGRPAPTNDPLPFLMHVLRQ